MKYQSAEFIAVPSLWSMIPLFTSPGRPVPGGWEVNWATARFVSDGDLGALQSGRHAPSGEGVMGQLALDVATLSAVAATVLSMSCTWPQVARIRRTGDVAGVSIAAAALTVSSELGWTLYLGGERLWSAVPEGLFNIAANAVLVLVVVRAGGSSRWALLGASCWLVALFGTRWMGGPQSMAALLAVGLRRPAHARGGHGLADVESQWHRDGYVVPATRRIVVVGRLRTRQG